MLLVERAMKKSETKADMYCGRGEGLCFEWGRGTPGKVTMEPRPEGSKGEPGG